MSAPKRALHQYVRRKLVCEIFVFFLFFAGPLLCLQFSVCMFFKKFPLTPLTHTSTAETRRHDSAGQARGPPFVQIPRDRNVVRPRNVCVCVLWSRVFDVNGNKTARLLSKQSVHTVSEEGRAEGLPACPASIRLSSMQDEASPMGLGMMRRSLLPLVLLSNSTLSPLQDKGRGRASGRMAAPRGRAQTVLTSMYINKQAYCVN